MPLTSEQIALSEQLQQKIDAATENGFSGSVLVSVDGTQLVRSNQGLSNRESNTPVTDDTAFDFNAIAMDFTAAAIFKLIELDQLDLSDSVGSILPEAPTDKAEITLLQLLQHSAGFEGSHADEGAFEVLTRLEARQRIFDLPLVFEPGRDKIVSAAGYTLLADIVQSVSGRDFSEFVRNELFEPAGLLHTGFYGEDRWRSGQTAIGYDAQVFDDNDPANWPYTWATVGNGGLVTTVDDFDRWLDNVSAGLIFSTSVTEEFNAQRQDYTGFESEPFGNAEATIYGGFGEYGHVSVVGDSPEINTRIIVTSNSSADAFDVITLTRVLIRTIFEPIPEGGRTAPLVFQNAVNNGFSGAALVRYRGEVLLDSASGFANRQAQIPNQTDTVFDMGSISKQYTGALMLALQEAGLLSVENRLSDHFDDVPSDKADITIHQLLSHTAGFVGGLGDDYDPIDRDEFLALAWSTPLEAEPGSEFLYSNVGYSVAAAIAEIVSGQTYEAVLLERLLTPGDISETGYVLPDWTGRTFAIGYDDIDSLDAVDEPWAEDGPYWHLRGNGGLLTTTNDLLKWHDVLSGESVLSSSSIDALQSRHVDEGLGQTFYGYGWVTEDTPVGPMLWHDGGNGFYFAQMLRFVDEDLVVIMLANEENDASIELTWDLARAASPGLEDWVSPSE